MSKPFQTYNQQLKILRNRKWKNYSVPEHDPLDAKLIEPWGQQRIPQYIQNAASITIGWNCNSLINAIV